MYNLKVAGKIVWYTSVYCRVMYFVKHCDLSIQLPSLEVIPVKNANEIVY